jgi:hypothetical protein
MLACSCLLLARPFPKADRLHSAPNSTQPLALLPQSPLLPQPSTPADLLPVLHQLEALALDRIRRLRLENPAAALSSNIEPRRGVSWLFDNLDGLLLGSPELHALVRDGVRLPRPGNVSFHIQAINSAPATCVPALANRVSIWVRAFGPEVHAVLASPVPGQCKWQATFFLSTPGLYTVYARLLHFGGEPTLTLPGLCTPANRTSSSAMRRVFAVHSPRKPTPLTCCTICDRFPACQAWTFEAASQTCVAFGARATPSTALPRVWQLGCGTSEGVENTHRCGSATYSPLRNASGSEDGARQAPAPPRLTCARQWFCSNGTTAWQSASPRRRRRRTRLGWARDPCAPPDRRILPRTAVGPRSPPRASCTAPRTAFPAWKTLCTATRCSPTPLPTPRRRAGRRST